ncbi:MAG: hypothetical protein SGBAC_007012 [Bacillariaceae sp.]
MRSLSHAVTLNNEGVSLLLQHNHRGAIHVLMDALSSVKQMLGAPAEAKIVVDAPDLIHDSTYTIPGFQDPSCFVFARAITLSRKDLGGVSVSDPDSMNEIAAAILLNIALAYHHVGQVDNSFLGKAELMYETASEIATMNQRRQGTSLLVEAASVNNLAQIRHARGEYSHSLQGFQNLASLLAHFGQDLQRATCGQEVYQGMLMNALLTTPPDAAAAA